jgi:hypothetical protein
VCAWIPGRTIGLNPKVVRDRYGFTVGNFSQTMPLGPELFAFPTQCIHVFYSDDKIKNVSVGGDWKVICGTDVRGRRGDLSIARPDIEMLASGPGFRFRRFGRSSIILVLDTSLTCD